MELIKLQMSLEVVHEIEEENGTNSKGRHHHNISKTTSNGILFDSGCYIQGTASAVVGISIFYDG